MATIFCEKQRKNTKNSRILAKKTSISSSNGVFYAVFMESNTSETNLFFKNFKKTRWPPYFSAKV